MEELEKLNLLEQNCLTLVLEFLASCNLKKTLKTLIEESPSIAMSIPDNIPKKPRIKKENVPVILSLMKSMDSSAFFQSWETLVPKEIQLLPDYKKLTIFLYVFFATLPQRKMRTLPLEMVSSTDKIVEPDITEKSSDNLRKLSNNKYDLFIEKERRNSKNKDVSPHSESEKFMANENRGNEAQETDVSNKKVLLLEVDAKSPPNESENQSEENVKKTLVESEKENISKLVENIQREGKIYENYAAMELFKHFLEGRGSEYTTEPEYLPYFALPFVDSPKDHPIFSNVFKESWTRDLESMLLHFLIEYSCGDAVVPELVKVCSAMNEESQEAPPSIKTQLDEYIQRYKEIKRKFYKLRRDHQNIVGVASELATALENSVRGEAVDLKAILENCVNIFPDLFLRSSSVNSSGCRRTKNCSVNKQMNFHELDVVRIKKDLTTGSIKSKLLLLQAFRWCLTHRTNDEREQFVSWMTRHDVLDLKNTGLKDDLVQDSTPHPVQQATTRLVNALASLRAGRDYLAASPTLVLALVQSAKSSSAADPIARDMMVAALQKLSLRTNACNSMLSNHMIEWLLEQLDGDHFQGYSLEYGTSLLMNLVLHSKPESLRDECTRFIRVITKLLRSCEKNVLEFIFGILYYVLCNDNLNIEFNKQGLEHLLSEKLENDVEKDAVTKQQLATLLSLHKRDITPEMITSTVGEAIEDDLDDPEVLDPEIDAGDLVPGTPSGEEFLEQRYRLIFPPRGIVKRMSQAKDERKICLRPSTPRSRLAPLELGYHSRQEN